jgi:sialate O-acetylesterase
MKRTLFRLSFRPLAIAIALVASSQFASLSRAEVKLPNVFSDHMVLQQGQENKIWGIGNPGETVSISLGDQSLNAKADDKGAWAAKLPSMKAGGGALKLTVKGSSVVEIKDVLIGEVWICSGQSNMQWNINQSNDADLERLAANNPNIRMINFPNVGKQAADAVWSHDNHKWQVSSSDTVGGFSAVGYFFARQINQTTGVPIGMINNAWGGSSAEAWVNRDVLKANNRFDAMMKRYVEAETQHAALSAKTARSPEEENQWNGLNGLMYGNARPGNIYYGVLKSHIGYGIKGAIWYQGESNAGRAYQYRELFPAMIQNWRQEWGQGDFPFYWVQLADFQDENKDPTDSNWAELREAQTMTMDKIANGGEAVIIDIGEGKDIHPKNKVDVGRRLARWALAKQYGIAIDCQSPRYESKEVNEGAMIVKFKHIESGWRPFDVNTLRGFTIAGEDKKFFNATATLLPDGRISVTAPEVSKPASVRYAWAQNPICNMFTNNGLPLTPFRTDDWQGTTANNE